MSYRVLPEDFASTRTIYDDTMAANSHIHDLLYPQVFGADQYVGQFSDNSAAELRQMGELLRLPGGSEVLDIGCGRGNVAWFMARTFNWRMTGIDIATVPIQYALRAHGGGPESCLEFVQSDVYEYRFERQFDGAYGTGAFCHFDAARLFDRIRTLLRTGGRIAFMERTRLGQIPPADWENLTAKWSCPYVYTVEEYLDLLARSGFRLLSVRDLTASFRVWQQRSVLARQDMRGAIVDLSSQQYYEASVAFASYENDVTRAGLLGYVCIVAELTVPAAG